MRAFDLETDHRRFARCGPEDAQAVDLAEFFGRVCEQFALACRHRVHAQRGQVIDRRAQADEAGDVRRAGLELVRRVVEHGTVEADFPDHLAAADEGRHRLQVFATRPQRAGAGRPAHLVAGDRVEVATDRGHVQRHVRRRLRAVDHGDDAALARLAADRRDRIHRAQHIADVGDRQQLHVGCHRRMQRVEIQRAVRQQLGDLDRRAGTLGDQLPRHDVGVVLHPRDQDGVAGLQSRQRPRVGDQVDREGRAAAQDQVVAVHAEERGQLPARAFVSLGGLAAQRVHRAADVGVVAAIEIVGRLDHRSRLLSGIRRVQIHQRLAMHFAREQREVLAHPRPVDGFCSLPCVQGRVAEGLRLARCVHAPSRASARSSAASQSSRVVASSIRATTSRQNAPVSSARASGSGRPRERR